MLAWDEIKKSHAFLYYFIGDKRIDFAGDRAGVAPMGSGFEAFSILDRRYKKI